MLPLCAEKHIAYIKKRFNKIEFLLKKYNIIRLIYYNADKISYWLSIFNNNIKNLTIKAKKISRLVLFFNSLINKLIYL